MCRVFYHGSCVGLNETELSVLAEQGRSWLCSPCNHKRRLSRSLSDTGVNDSEDVKEMIRLLGEKIDSGLKRLENDLGSSLNMCHEKLDENSQLLMAQKAIIEKQNELIDSLRQENQNLSKRVSELSERLDDAEQYSRSNTLEIFGVPTSQNEDVTQTVIGVGKALDLKITEDMIDVCHRLKPLNNRPSSGIIVRFVRRTVKEAFLAKRRVKRTLSTRHMGLAMDSPIYINQSLSQRKRILFAKAKKVQSERDFKFLWIDRSGNIRIRKSEGTTIHTIKSEIDIAKLADNAV
ncbi:uncharacterized protein LOC111045539 [Nilaparvata lugens]|uniref:uncharacterized protein LOC111045539 n=1 Tax=Nilaparvata lugens TaxID=108931 RepID=UPI00193E8C98|nr:uncharacterized protein LOC111045539 [Nilaparvata lugens]